ncbi:putative leucine rich repeat domain containing protein [Diaporthe ampelina]|uniref:Putative leucine rich repeat domain containing protein n=1 Tax=Diaporthe ampelina TaxID=1214573 RepID=A0A0G2FVV8_9PEZI|nr:putative leucine rich repeat domain containing protein [Diaporthe ampelina]
MNPRLYSLTISMIPRYSTGTVCQRLTNFLRLAAIQEQAIESTRAMLPFRGPPVLQGLRHVRLEFEPDAKDELGSLDSETDDLDSEALLEQGTEAFSFFSESAWGTSSSPARSRVKTQTAVAAGAEAADTKDQGPFTTEEKIDGYPFNKARDEQVSFTTNAGGDHNQPSKLVSVWVGSGIISPENPPAVNEYTRNVCDAANRGGVCPATPCHVAAGVPAGSFIFERAWDSIMLPAATAEVRLPTKAELRGMQDVVARIKAFRLESRRQYAALDAGRRNVSGHEYWRGRLELVLPQGRVHSSDYWR